MIANINRISALPTSLRQPGPAGDPLNVVPCGVIDVKLDVPAHEPLALSLPRELKRLGMDGGYVRIRDVAVSALTYVIPDDKNDSDHVAWYSEDRNPAMPGRIIDAGIDCGFYKGAPFFHCHGVLEDANGAELMGHFLIESCVPSHAVLVQAMGFHGAHFDRVYDPESHFDLFKPKSVSRMPDDANGLLIRVGPNVDICGAIAECCQDSGWKRATVHGVGSFIGAHFTDGRVMKSLVTEALITAGSVDLNAPESPVDLDICLVGLDGRHTSGKLSAGNNPVLITVELILKRDDGG